MALYSVLASLDLTDLFTVPQLMLGSIVIGVIGMGIPFVKTYRHWKGQLEGCKSQQETYKTLLNVANEARCWWQNEAQPVETTPSMIYLLGLNGDRPIFLQDIVNQFAIEDAFRLNTYLAELQKNHITFNEKFHLVDERTIIRISGINFNENAYYFTALSFSDVTNEYQAISLLQKKVNHLLSEQQRLNLLLDLVPMAIWYRGADNKINFCNQVYAGILDTIPQRALEEERELVEKTKSYSPFQLAQKAVVTAQPQSKRAHVVIEGHRRMLEITTVPLVDKKESIGYAVDLTDIEESAAELAKHIAAHQEVLHHLSTPIAVYASDTRLEFFNTAYLKLFQFDEKWLYQRPTFAEVLQDLRERRKLPEYTDFAAFKAAQLHLFNTLINPLQEMIHQPDGQILRIMTVPHPLGGLLFMFDDVTDKLSLERLKISTIKLDKKLSRSMGCIRKVNWPASTLAKSMMSLIRESNRCDESSMPRQ